jgi:hypothetical protein
MIVPFSFRPFPAGVLTAAVLFSTLCASPADAVTGRTGPGAATHAATARVSSAEHRARQIITPVGPGLEKPLRAWPGSNPERLSPGNYGQEVATWDSVRELVRRLPAGEGGEFVTDFPGQPDLKVRYWVWKDSLSERPLAMNRVTAVEFEPGNQVSRFFPQSEFSLGRYIPHNGELDPEETDSDDAR